MRGMDRCQSTVSRAGAAPTAAPAIAITSPGAVVNGTAVAPAASRTGAPTAVSAKVPPQTWFVISAIFHYLGPSFAVLLFPAVGVLGVAWFRIASAAAVFAPLTKPWSAIAQADARTRRLMLA